MVYVFGSFARGALEPNDVDLAVDFSQDERMRQRFVAYRPSSSRRTSYSYWTCRCGLLLAAGKSPKNCRTVSSSSRNRPSTYGSGGWSQIPIRELRRESRPDRGTGFAGPSQRPR
ncbi:nucleotidyltransferase domain-containing protein [Streptomyces sp. NPDC023838]|uniref:nucleotidyltransferase domain-containing protein n=1 Tax=Streptomyces sp. NPDC023838 TaxID=3154325 RepID=UPI0033C8518F